MNRFGFIVVGFLALCFALTFGAALWIFSVDAEWSPLIESRISSRRVDGSVSVKAKNEDGNWEWIASLNNGRLEERKPVTLADTPPQLVQAIVQIEDPRFHSHEGFDLFGILRALLRNVISLRYAQGGSTITQQLVKNVFLTNEKTLKRKFTELVLAALVEKRFPKDAILEAYINEVYMGQQGPIAIHGVAKAAEYYFNKDLDDLNLAETSLLVAMIKGPGYYSPWRYPERTKNRRDFVLKLLAEANLILTEEKEEAENAPLPTKAYINSSTRASYLLDLARKKIIADLGESAVVEGGIEIRLSIDTKIQKTAETSLRTLGKDWPTDLQALTIAVDPKSCQIKAYVGGRNYSLTQYDRITKSKRSIGSLMKPLGAMYFIENNIYSIGSALSDAPLDWAYDSGRGMWSPENYDKEFRKQVTLRTAIEKSINVPIARMFYETEPTGLLFDLLKPVKDFGLVIPPNRALPSAVLGAIEQRPWDVALAYTRLSRVALGLDPKNGCEDLEYLVSINKVTNQPVEKEKKQDNNASVEKDKKWTELDNTFAAQQIISAMQGATRRGTSAFLKNKLSPDHSWGGKTGTSSDKKDAWYAAVSPNLVVVTWFGSDKALETKYTGASAAAPLSAPILQSIETETWQLSKKLQWQGYDIENMCFLTSLENMSFLDLYPASSLKFPSEATYSFKGRQVRHELFILENEPAKICQPL